METSPQPVIMQELLPQDTLERYRQLEAFVEAKIAASPGSIALVAVDLERLKEVNDTYGHPEGTRYIQNALEVLRGYVRGGDGENRPADSVVTGQALHTSGDEFWVVLENITDQEGVNAFVSRTQQALDDLGIGAAIGGSVHLPGGSAAQLIIEADTLMYQNKMDRVPEMSRASEEQLLGAVATIEALGISIRSVPLYLESILERRVKET